MARDITVHAFVREPFDKYVHDNSRFWNASGAKVQLGANGLAVPGRIAARHGAGRHRLRNPGRSEDHRRKRADHAFTLYPERGRRRLLDLQAQRPVRRQLHRFGCWPGRRVAGHPARPEDRRGHQRLAGLRPAAATTSWSPSISPWSPSASPCWTCRPTATWTAKMSELVQRGLRVKLETGNFLTGQKQLAMDIFHDAAPASWASKARTMSSRSRRQWRRYRHRRRQPGQPPERHPVRSHRQEPEPDPRGRERAGQRQAAGRDSMAALQPPWPARRRW